MFLDCPLPQNKTLKISYTSDGATGGSTLLVIGWVPRSGNAVPESEDLAVAPNASRSLSLTIPPYDNARRLEVWVALPPSGGKGTFVLTVEDEDTAVDIVANTKLTALVVPE